MTHAMSPLLRWLEEAGDSDSDDNDDDSDEDPPVFLGGLTFRKYTFKKEGVDTVYVYTSMGLCLC